MSDDLCASCGMPDSTAAPRPRLCPVCRGRLRTSLAALPGLHEACADELAPAARWLRERVTGGTPAGIVLRENVATARSDVKTVLVAWASLVVEERRVRGPEGREVAPVVAFLQRHLDWLAAHPAAGEFAAEIAGLESALGAVIDPGASAGVAVSRCDQPGCAEPVLVRFEAGDPENYPVSCAAGHRVPPERWLRMALGGASEPGRGLRPGRSAVRSEPDPAAA
jgi:hypothetical protein